MGNHTSDLMSESDVGLIVSETRQKAGRVAIDCDAAPPGALNCPAATGCAAVTVVFGSFNAAARFAQSAAERGASCA
jgi:hypothetical protein